ncbi:MAG: coproporphyrinogen III oxidase, partial [Phenylobacterium sp.]|nr:coproporphyrinogen III oxidase [Phenylobacterium sp.]
MIDPVVLESRNTRARAWFDDLRDRIVAAFEQLEIDAPADLYPGEPAKFVLKPLVREAGGGGVMGFLRGGRFIEKMG